MNQPEGLYQAPADFLQDEGCELSEQSEQSEQSELSELFELSEPSVFDLGQMNLTIFQILSVIS